MVSHTNKIYLLLFSLAKFLSQVRLVLFLQVSSLIIIYEILYI